MHLSRTAAPWRAPVAQTAIYVLFAFSLARYTNYLEFVNREDGAENIANAFFLSQGWRAFSDFGSNHFPGVYLYLAPFLKLFGFQSGFQGTAFFERITLAGSFATVLFQVALFTLALRLCGLRALSATWAIAGISVWLYAWWNAHLPLSETFCIGIYALWLVLVHRAVLAPRARQRFVAAFWLIPLGVAATWFGLTQAFANALGALFGAAAMRAARAGAADRRVYRHVAAGVALCLALLLVTLWRADIAGLVYYNFEVNLHLIRPLAGMQPAAIGDRHFIRLSEIPLFAGLPLLLLLVLLVAWRGAREGRDRRSLAMFCAVAIAAGVLTFWRETIGFHTSPILGIQLGLMFLLAGSLRRAIRRSRFQPVLARYGREAHYLGLGLMLATTLLFSGNLRTLLSRAEFPAARPAAFEGACRFAEEAGCACTRVVHFAPSFFLRHDLRPCRGGYAFWTPLLLHYPPLWSEYLREVGSHRGAYAILEPLDLSFPEEIARRIERGYACRQVGPETGIAKPFRLCLPPR